MALKGESRKAQLWALLYMDKIEQILRERKVQALPFVLDMPSQPRGMAIRMCQEVNLARKQARAAGKASALDWKLTSFQAPLPSEYLFKLESPVPTRPRNSKMFDAAVAYAGTSSGLPASGPTTSRVSLSEHAPAPLRGASPSEVIVDDPQEDLLSSYMKGEGK